MAPWKPHFNINVTTIKIPYPASTFSPWKQYNNVTMGIPFLWDPMNLNIDKNPIIIFFCEKVFSTVSGCLTDRHYKQRQGFKIPWVQGPGPFDFTLGPLEFFTVKVLWTLPFFVGTIFWKHFLPVFKTVSKSLNYYNLSKLLFSDHFQKWKYNAQLLWQQYWLSGYKLYMIYLINQEYKQSWSTWVYSVLVHKDLPLPIWDLPIFIWDLPKIMAKSPEPFLANEVDQHEFIRFYHTWTFNCRYGSSQS